MRLALFIFILFSCCEAKAQGGIFLKPDYEAIKKDVLADSAGYYVLLSRLEASDSTLSPANYRYLYYGYVYTKNYHPYWMFDKRDKLETYYRKRNLNKKDYDKALALTSEALAQFPFDLQTLNYSIYIYDLKGDKATAKKLARRFYSTLNAILSTGNGETCETAFHVISTAHEYTILNFFGYDFRMQSLRGYCDHLAIGKNDRDLKGLYFDVSRLFEKSADMFKKKD